MAGVAAKENGGGRNQSGVIEMAIGATKAIAACRASASA